MAETALVEHASAPAPEPAKGKVFAFGDPESVIDRRELSSYFEIWHNNTWYEPPLPMDKLAQSFNMSPHHRSAIGMKVNQLVNRQIETRWLSSANFERFALDFLQMGNSYLELVPNLAGRIAAARFSPARHMRRGVEEGVYWFINGPIGKQHAFPKDHIFHLQQPDVAQEIYGLPEWLSALQSGLLNENATLFRRRYYKNGAHAGAVFYLTDPLASQDMADAMEDAIIGARGIGNFKNLFVHSPGGKKDGLQIMNIAEATAKDEFSNIKNISRDDLLAAHRMPPQLIGIIPQNTGGFGKPSEALDSFFELEVVPIMKRMRRMNAWFGVELMRFSDYRCSNGDVITPDGERIPASRVR